MSSLKNLVLAGFVSLIAACSSSVLPGPLYASNFPPAGPVNYQQGMVDGCKTASGATGGALMGLIYDQVYYDVNKTLSDHVYATAWKDGYHYCKYDADSGPLS